MNIDTKSFTNIVILQIKKQGDHYPVSLFYEVNGQPKVLKGQLPPIPQELWDLTQRIKESYHRLGGRINVSKKQPSSPLPASELSLEDLLSQLEQDEISLMEGINQWLNQETVEWTKIKTILEFLSLDSLNLLLDCQEHKLRLIPLEQWQLLQKSKVNFSFYFGGKELKDINISSLDVFRQTEAHQILGIFAGQENEFNFTRERDLWQKYVSAVSSSGKFNYWRNPKRKQFISLWRDKWNIIYFGGHSQTINDHQGNFQGMWQINEQEEIAIADLAKTLEKANQNALKLVIFNSCDGLGIAANLAQLNVHNLAVICMRYPIPDCVAPKFLEYFLEGVKNNCSIFKSLTEAKAKLFEVSEFQLFPENSNEVRLPALSFVPTLTLINPSTPKEKEPSLSEHKNLTSQLPLLVIFSLVLSLIVIFLRSLGLGEGLEFKTYDLLLKLRPNEGIDPRLLLVTITEEDVKAQPSSERGAASLSDQSLHQLSQKLEASEALAIGLDIYRDNPVNPQFSELAESMKTSERFLGICKYGKNSASLPPSEIPPSRQGFNNILLDSDGQLRRSLLAVESPAPCQSPYAFSLQLARHYLAQKHPHLEFIPRNEDGYIQIEHQAFKRLRSSRGGIYQSLDDRGHQVMINYRQTDKIAEMVDLMTFLQDYPLEKVGERIVIIGTIAPSFNDHRWPTPMGEISGVEIQAHLVSHLLSLVLEKRPLIWFLSGALENILIVSVSVMGGVIILVFWSQTAKNILLLGGISGILMILVVSSVQLWGLYLPLIPLMIVLMGNYWFIHWFYHGDPISND